MIKQSKISLRKGVKNDLPTNAPLGEPLFCMDTGEMYVGMGEDSPIKQVVDTEVKSQLETNVQQIEKLKNKGITNKVLNFKTDALGFKSINLIGDSISHGANCPKIYEDSYTEILRRAFNIEFNNTNRGYCSMLSPLSNAQGVYNDYIYWGSAGGWSSENTTNTLGFRQVKLTGTNYIGGYVQVAKKVNKIGVAVKNNANGTIKVLIEEKTTSGSLETIVNIIQTDKIKWIDISILSDFGRITITNVSGENCITGIYVMDNIDDIVFNNYSRSGAKISDMGDDVIDNAFNTNILIFSLGHNGGTDLDTYFGKCKQAYDKYKPIVYVVDLNWKKANQYISDKLDDLAKYCNTELIKIVDKVDSEQTLVDSGFLSDYSHPTVAGHELIINTLLNKLSTSFLSKKSINKFLDIKYQNDTINSLVNTGVVAYKGKLDKSCPSYQYFKDVKFAMELIEEVDGSVPEVWLGRSTDVNNNDIYILKTETSNSAWAFVPLSQGISDFTNASWVTSKFKARCSIDSDIATQIANIPRGKRCKVIFYKVNNFTTKPTSVIDLIRYS